MAKVAFTMEDSEDGQSIVCECRADDTSQVNTSPALMVASYLADNWVGLVQAARLARNAAMLREGQSMAKEDELRKAPGLVDEYGAELPPLNPLLLSKLN